MRLAPDRADDRREAGATRAKRPVSGGGGLSIDDDASLVERIANPFREGPAWLQPFMIGMAAVALVLIQLGALPAGMVPWPGAAVFIARRRSALVGAGVALLGALGVAALTV